MTKTYNYELGMCECCDVKIADQDKYQTTTDGCILCEKDAATYQDILDQWNEYEGDDYPVPFDTLAEFIEKRNELRAQTNLHEKPLRGPEVTA